VVALLKVSTGDDHGKNSHQCLAMYQLLVNPDRYSPLDSLAA
jgi:hypothetical protein